MLGTAFEFEWETSAYVLLNSLVHKTHSTKGIPGIKSQFLTTRARPPFFSFLTSFLITKNFRVEFLIF